MEPLWPSIGSSSTNRQVLFLLHPRALPREMELNPKAKGGVSPSWMEMLTLEMEVLKMMGARIWGKVLYRDKTSLFDKERIAASYHGSSQKSV